MVLRSCRETQEVEVILPFYGMVGVDRAFTVVVSQAKRPLFRIVLITYGVDVLVAPTEFFITCRAAPLDPLVIEGEGVGAVTIAEAHAEFAGLLKLQVVAAFGVVVFHRDGGPVLGSQDQAVVEIVGHSDHRTHVGIPLLVERMTMFRAPKKFPTFKLDVQHPHLQDRSDTDTQTHFPQCQRCGDVHQHQIVLHLHQAVFGRCVGEVDAHPRHSPHTQACVGASAQVGGVLDRGHQVEGRVAVVPLSVFTRFGTDIGEKERHTPRDFTVLHVGDQRRVGEPGFGSEGRGDTHPAHSHAFCSGGDHLITVGGVEGEGGA